MQLYVWVNDLYLGPKQYGIQSLHVLGEMIHKYPGGIDTPTEFHHDILMDWARDHKTVIILKGTNSGTLRRTWEQLEAINTLYPMARFNEDEESLDGALTAVGFIAPEPVYAFGRALREFGYRGGPVDQLVAPGMEDITDHDKALAAMVAVGSLA